LTVAAVVLAAGEASRFGGPKQARLLPHVLRAIRGARSVEDVVVVLGAYELAVSGARVVHAPEWARGPGASLRAGLAALAPTAEAAVVCLADGPLLAPAAIDRVVAAWRDGAGDVVAASYGGRRGHPVCLDRRVWNRIPDAGARELDAVLVACDDLGEPGDVDTVEELRKLERSLAARAGDDDAR
jgi:CTP:molybdopterin cytidylyltransferase MocA